MRIWICTTLAVATWTIGSASARAADGVDACALATPAEIEAATGLKVANLKGGSVSATTAICTGSAPTASVMLRIASKSAKGGDPAAAAAAGIAMAKAKGIAVDVKTFGPMTCSTITPPASLVQYGFNTTCSISKDGRLAAIEVTVKDQKDQVPIEKLKAVADKMTARF